MVNLWATYCGPCIGEMPQIEKMSQDLASRGGGVVGLTLDVSVGNDEHLESAQINVYPKVMEDLLSEAE